MVQTNQAQRTSVLRAMEQGMHMAPHIDATDLVVRARRFMAFYARSLYTWFYDPVVVQALSISQPDGPVSRRRTASQQQRLRAALRGNDAECRVIRRIVQRRQQRQVLPISGWEKLGRRCIATALHRGDLHGRMLIGCRSAIHL